MSQLIIAEIEEGVLQRLRDQATAHGRTTEAEARAILEDALRRQQTDVWARVDAIYERLAASGRTFSDSAELLREDRDR
jgi:plasmid stability protein